MKCLLSTALILMFAGAMSAPTHAADPLKEFFKNKTKIENPFELRDPFKAPSGKNDKNIKRSGYYIQGKGNYSNIPEINLTSITDLKVVGVLIGKERRAMVQASGGKVLIIKEGMKIGEDGAELKAILPGGVIIVEKIVNVYGQEEYLETVVPISK